MEHEITWGLAFLSCLNALALMVLKCLTCISWRTVLAKRTMLAIRVLFNIQPQ